MIEMHCVPRVEWYITRLPYDPVFASGFDVVVWIRHLLDLVLT